MGDVVRNLMFVFTDIAKMADHDLETVLKKVDPKDLTVALKPCDPSLRQRFLGHLSDETRTLVTEELENLSPMRLSEVEEVQLRIVKQVRKLEEQGKVTIVRGDGNETWV